MEDIDGGLHPAVDEQSLDKDEDDDMHGKHRNPFNVHSLRHNVSQMTRIKCHHPSRNKTEKGAWRVDGN